jgi:hypothetical protein
MSEIQNKVVIITGASSGLGAATAERLAANGAKLMLAARREDRLKELVAAIERSGWTADYLVTDVSDRAQVEALAQKTLSTYGRIDVLINNAGLMPLDALKVDEWERMIDRKELLELSLASEAELGHSCITDWLSPEFFETEFWYMWATTFAFQPWHSAVEFKRYLHRFVMEFTRIETLAGVKRTVYNQYDYAAFAYRSTITHPAQFPQPRFHQSICRDS